MPAPRFQAVRSGRLLDIAGHRSDYSDILIEGNVIREIGAAGMAGLIYATSLPLATRIYEHLRNCINIYKQLRTFTSIY